ncbi:MAG: hypothetical protein SNJ53_03805, partial [Thermodesulfovibrionales bacterium]
NRRHFMATEKIDDILKEYEEGLRKAMVCTNSEQTSKTICDAIRELKYAPDIPVNVDDAFEKIKFNQYDLIIIDENYGGKGIEGNDFLKHLQLMPMVTRRKMFVALIGSGFKTFDNMSAFEQSVNLVTNVNDIPSIKVILRKAISDNDQFYKVFRETLSKFGKY